MRGESEITSKSELNIPGAIVFVVLITALGIAQGVSLHLAAVPLAATVLSCLIFLCGYFLLGTERAITRLSACPSGKIVALAVLGPAFVYLLYGAGTGTSSLASLGRIVVYAVLPFVILQRKSEPAGWRDLLAIAALWFPLEFHLLRSVWPWPDGRLNYIFGQLLGMNVGLLAFVVFRGFGGVGYRFRLVKADGLRGLENFLAFAIIAIPLGLWIHFILYTGPAGKWGEVPFSLLTIFLFIALPEELLFRGLIQNAFQQRLRSQTLALLLAAIIFGASHLNNGPFPNWRYFLLATIAGIFYGRAYRATGCLMASALTHTLVDAAWHLLFR